MRNPIDEKVQRAFTTNAEVRDISGPGKLNSQDVDISTELFRFKNANGYSVACIRPTRRGLTRGPLLCEPPMSDGWGYHWEPLRPTVIDGIVLEVDVCHAFAYGVQNIIVQRNALADALRAILLEVASSGYLNRGEECLVHADAILELLAGNTEAPNA